MRYLILNVEFNSETDYGRELKWIAPELADEAGLTLTEDDDSHRKWAGEVSDESYAKLANSWSLDAAESEPNLGMLTEFGHLEALAFNFDGMDWNAGGVTPILYASLYVTPEGVREVKTDANQI